MTKRRVIIELAARPALAAASRASRLSGRLASALSGVNLDRSFPPVPLPRLTGRPPTLTIPSYIVRAEIDDEQAAALRSQDGVIGLFADVAMHAFANCPGDGPFGFGTDADVERLLCTSRLHRVGADGRDVLVAIVDTGINIDFLRKRGKNPRFDPARSWTPRADLTPGAMPVGHGTACAFDACIAAPACTLLDIALLTSTAAGESEMEGRLSDAVRAYNHLADIMRAPRRPGEPRSLVVNNSWGMYRPSEDYPVGHEGNYSDNPRHPFNVIVNTLEGLGADILFAAGNCGSDCPSPYCAGATEAAIYGANGHPKVLSVAGVDIHHRRLGYSSQGPGRLSRVSLKPDLCGYTHFIGSKTRPYDEAELIHYPDSGTSAAAPVVAGLVAAWRSQNHYEPGDPTRSPQMVRRMMRETCRDLGDKGFDFDHGYGIVQGCKLADQWIEAVNSKFCLLFPRLCAPLVVPPVFTKRFPDLCVEGYLPIPGYWPFPGSGADADFAKAAPYATLDLGENAEKLDDLDRDELMELFYLLGYLVALERPEMPAAPPAPERAGGCGCR